MLNKSKILKANAVLAIVEDLLKYNQETVYLYLSMYSNSREQGYTIFNFDVNKKISFSENRNSDDIVVYPGKNNRDDSLSEEQYKNKIFFKFYEKEKAAEYILEFLLEKKEKGK